MLRCGLRVNEVAKLSLDCIDYRRSRILIMAGKGAKDRIVFISNDAARALADYLQHRPVITSYSIHYTKLYEFTNIECKIVAIS